MGIIPFIFTINYTKSIFSDFFILELLLDHRSDIKTYQILREKWATLSYYGIYLRCEGSIWKRRADVVKLAFILILATRNQKHLRMVSVS